MAYSLNGKVYSDHPLMDEIIYNTKLILNDIILKNDATANENETVESMRDSDYFIAIKNGSMNLHFFPLTTDLLVQYGYSSLQAKIFITDRTQIPSEDRESLLEFCNNWYLDNYVEYNNYFRMLNGLPEYGTDEYDIYIDPSNPKLIDDDANTDFNFSIPIHQFSLNEINTLSSLGIMDDLLSIYTGKHYRYLKYLGAKRIDIYTARMAANWDILYMPNVEYLVKSRFKELYKVNRDIYMRRTYQQAYKFESEYYDEMMMILILCQTLTDMVVDTPEWYIRRDVFDLRTVQYFLESQGVKFFKIIPLKYQIRIVKRLNTLIRYKSTTKNINDILNIFSIDGTTVYKYYLYKKHLKNINEEDTIDIPELKPWELTDMDFGDEDTFNYIADTFNTDVTNYDFWDESKGDLLRIGPSYDYDFGNEDASDPDSSTRTDEKEEAAERDRIVTDEVGNIYDLQFVKVPIDESYDDYIKDDIYRADYDVVTNADPYWDGEDVHSYVKNKHLEKDFTIEGTKYMSLDYTVSVSEFMYQMCYFLGLIFTSSTDLEDITVSIPSIKANTAFNITDIFVLLYCLSGVFDNKVLDINIPRQLSRNQKKPEYQNYDIFDGGYPWDGYDAIPENPVIDPEWEMDSEYDFGCEETDNIVRNSQTEYYDFGYHYDINPKYPMRIFDFGEIFIGSYEGVETIRPTADGWVLGYMYDYGAEEDDYIEPDKNWTYDAPNYDFYDIEEETATNIGPNTRFYDFLSEEILYIEEEIPDPPKDEDDLYPWDLLEKNQYTEDLNGGPVDIKRKYRRNIDGGEGRYSVVRHESHYEWMRWDNPQLFIPTSDRIFGFNLSVDMEEVEKNINIAHSSFGFEKGYTLKDFGVDSFIVTNKISTIEEMIDIYDTNTKCYKALEELLISPNTRDDAVSLWYVFDNLFTRPFDFNFYRLKSGEIALTYDQILAERNYTLYKYYLEILKEKDLEIRKDNIRAILNDIVGTLEYYINSDHLKYIFEFVPTHSFTAITKYISLMINFFKSWKVYFLDPTVTYIVDDKKENKVGVGDMMTEIRIGYWYNDTSNIREFCTVKPIYYLEERDAGQRYEVIDMYAYHTTNIDDIYYDGGFPNTSILLGENYGDLNGGAVEFETCHPFIMVDCGNIAARKDIYNLDNAGPMVMQEYLNVDGLSVTDYYSSYPVTNDFKVANFDVDGGPVSPGIEYSSTLNITAQDQIIQADVRLSTYRFNDIILEKDGLYIEDRFASLIEFNELKRQMDSDRIQLNDELAEYLYTIQLYTDPLLIEEMINNIYKSYFIVSESVLEDYMYNITGNYITDYVDTKVADLKQWFLELNLFAWDYF